MSLGMSDLGVYGFRNRDLRALQSLLKQKKENGILGHIWVQNFDLGICRFRTS